LYCSISPDKCHPYDAAKNLKSIFFYLTSENSLDGYAIAARMRRPMEIIDETTGETIEWNTA